MVSLLATLLVLLVATFGMVHLIPGDPARQVLGPHATNASVKRLRHTLGLDKPLGTQFVDYTSHAVRLDFGNSFETGEAVSTVLRQRLPKTLELAAAALALLCVFGIVGGISAAIITRDDRHPRIETLFMVTTGLGGAIPNYLAATFLIYIFAVAFQLLPASGADQPGSIILPALAIALRPSALMARIVRVDTLDVFTDDYVRAARSKRLRSRRIYGRYVFPNVLNPALTYGGLQFVGLVGSTVIVENVFAWPGLGTLVVQAIPKLDYPVIQGATLLLGLIVVVVIALVDAVRGIVDPQSAVGGP